MNNRTCRKQSKGSEMGSGRCREHPDNKQLPGVCSSCLREKLSNLQLLCNHKPISPCNSSLTSDSPSEATSSNYVPQTVYHRRRHRRNTSNMIDSVSSSEIGFDYGFRKSRSIAFASINGVSESYTRKKDGIWSKLLKLTRKGTKNVLKHSATLRKRRG